MLDEIPKTSFSPILLKTVCLSLLPFSAAVANANKDDLPFSNVYPDLKKNVGSDFTFVILADPQVKADADGPSKGETLVLNAEKFVATIDEINAMNPQPAFVAIAGDVVGAPTDYAFKYYVSMAQKLKPPQINVHGNHDGVSPYENFIKHVGKPLSNVENGYFSYDAGQWHFIAIPCDMKPDYSAQFLDWLAKDLEANKKRPTMVFMHEPMMPMGLTQLEFYTHPMPERIAITDLLTKHGNVSYVFNGHVHTGLKSSIKTSWMYKGTRFFNCPTTTRTRNFGEEFEGFEASLDKGGSYLVVDVKGDKVELKGRVAGAKGEIVYPGTFPEFNPELEPRWFTRVADFIPNAAVINGGFEHGLDGWLKVYRYIAEESPGFIVETTDRKARSGKNALYVYCREKGENWCYDETNEAYQVIKAPRKASPIVKVSYQVDKIPAEGGGYIKIMGFSDGAFQFLMVFDWAKDRYRSIHFPRSTYFTATGEKDGAHILYKLGQEKKAMFWEFEPVKGHWNDLVLDIQTLYDETHKKPGAYTALGIDKLFIGIGVWVDPIEGSECSAYFDDVNVIFDKSEVEPTKLKTNESVFTTGYGGRIVDQQKEARKN